MLRGVLVGFRSKAGPVLGLLVLAALLALLWRPLLNLLSNAEELRQWVLRFGALAPAALIVLEAAQVMLAPLPGNVIEAAGGYLFGVWQGTLYGLCGVLIGVTMACSLSRHFGRPLLRRIISAERMEQWDEAAHINSLSTWLVILVLPFGDTSYFVAGLTRIPIPKLALAALLTRAPTIFLGCLIGANIATIPPALLVGALGAFSSVLLVGYWAWGRLEALLWDRILGPILRGRGWRRDAQ